MVVYRQDLELAGCYAIRTEGVITSNTDVKGVLKPAIEQKVPHSTFYVVIGDTYTSHVSVNSAADNGDGYRRQGVDVPSLVALYRSVSITCASNDKTIAEGELERIVRELNMLEVRLNTTPELAVRAQLVIVIQQHRGRAI